MSINKDYLVYGIAILIFLLILSFFPLWYFTVRAPQYRVALTFLEGLKIRNKRMLKATVSAEEYETYKELYLRNGYNKHLLRYDNLEARETDGVFSPHRIRFSVLGREDDVFFGKRELSYVLSLERINNEWKVVQFASYEDTEDLKELKKIRTQIVAPPAQ
jgi:hypothetical protein